VHPTDHSSSRQHADVISYFAVTGGLLWILRSRSMARKPSEEKQERVHDTIDRQSEPTVGQDMIKGDPLTRR
jgi:hypothetical protein